MTANLIELNKANFGREVLHAGQPVLVEFWARWSAPCKAMAPVVEAVAQDPVIAVKVTMVDVEQNEGLVEKYGVRSVPTLLIFNQGGLRDQIVGRATEQYVREKLERLK